MKKGFGFIAALLVLCYAMAFAATPPAIQPNTMFAPKPASAACVALPAGSASTVTVSVIDTRLFSWQALTSAYSSTAVVVKRFLKSGTTTNTAYKAASSEGPVGVSTLATAFVFGKFSAASNPAAVICYDKN